MLRVISVQDIPKYYPPSEHIADIFSLKNSLPDAVEVCWDKRQFVTVYQAQPAYANALKKFGLWDEYDTITRKDRLFLVKRTLCNGVADYGAKDDTV